MSLSILNKLLGISSRIFFKDLDVRELSESLGLEEKVVFHGWKGLSDLQKNSWKEYTLDNKDKMNEIEKKARQRIKSLFTWKKAAEKHLAIYKLF